MTMESLVKTEKLDSFEIGHSYSHIHNGIDNKSNIFFSSATVDTTSSCTTASDTFKPFPEFTHTSLFPMMSLLLGHTNSQYYDKPLYDIPPPHFSPDIKSSTLPPFNFAKISSITGEDIRTESPSTSPTIYNNNNKGETPEHSLPFPQFTVIPEDDAENLTPTICQEPAAHEVLPAIITKDNTKKKTRQRKRKAPGDSAQSANAGSSTGAPKSKRAKKTNGDSNKRKGKKQKGSLEQQVSNSNSENDIPAATALEMGVLLVKSCLESIQNAVKEEDDDDDDDDDYENASINSFDSKKSSSKNRRRDNSEVIFIHKHSLISNNNTIY